MAVRKAPAKKTPAKKAPAKKAAAKKAPAKKAAAAPAKVKAIKERYSKTQVLDQISQTTELSRKQVSSVLEELSNIIEGHVSKRGCGEFVCAHVSLGNGCCPRPPSHFQSSCTSDVD